MLKKPVKNGPTGTDSQSSSSRVAPPAFGLGEEERIMYDPMEQMELEADTLYLAEIEYELARNMSAAFVDATPPGNLRMAAMSIATARWDAVRRDVEKGRLSQDDARVLYKRAVAHKVITPQMAKHQIVLSCS